MRSLLNSLLERLRAATDPKVTLADVAERAGTGASYVSKVESGGLQRPSPAVFAAMADLYGIAPDLERVLSEAIVASGPDVLLLPADDPLARRWQNDLRAAVRKHCQDKVRRLLEVSIPEAAVVDPDPKAETVLLPGAILAEAVKSGRPTWVRTQPLRDEFLRRLEAATNLRVCLRTPPGVRVDDPNPADVECYGSLLLATNDRAGLVLTADRERIEQFQNDFRRYWDSALDYKRGYSCAAYLLDQGETFRTDAFADKALERMEGIFEKQRKVPKGKAKKHWRSE